MLNRNHCPFFRQSLQTRQRAGKAERDSSIGIEIAEQASVEAVATRQEGLVPHFEIGDSGRGVAVKKKQPNRRHHPRFIVEAGTGGRITTDYEASLLNISIGGVLIEHAQVVRPGTISSVGLELQGKRLRVRCRVIRSVVNRSEVQPDGERAVIYHTGLEFVDLSEETLQVICDYIQSIIGDGKAIPTDYTSIRRWYTCEKCSTSFELTDAEVRAVSLESRKRPVQTGDLFYYDHGACQGTLMYTFGGPDSPWIVNEEA